MDNRRFNFHIHWQIASDMLALPIEYSTEVCEPQSYHQPSEECREEQCASFQQQNQEFDCHIKGMNHYWNYNVSVLAKNAVGKVKSDAVAVFPVFLGEFLRLYMGYFHCHDSLSRLHIKFAKT